MGLQALKIVEKEFNDHLSRANHHVGTDSVLKHLRDRIMERIEKECIEIPEEEISKVNKIGLGSTQADLDEARGSFLADYVDGIHKHHGGW